MASIYTIKENCSYPSMVISGTGSENALVLFEYVDLNRVMAC